MLTNINLNFVSSNGEGLIAFAEGDWFAFVKASSLLNLSSEN